MTEQETVNNEVHEKLAIHDEKFNSLILKIDATNNRIDDFINEMRDRDNQRAEDMREIRASVSSIRTLTVTTIVAIAAMVITILLK